MTTLHFAVTPGSVRTDYLVSNGQLNGGNLKQGGQSQPAVEKMVGVRLPERVSPECHVGHTT